MSAVTQAQLALLDARHADYLKWQPEFAILVDRLLAIAGVQVVPPGMPDPHLEQLLGQGQLWEGSAKLVPGTRGRCHENTARLYQRNPARFCVVTGYALSADSLWRQHSWGYDTAPRSRRRTVETTERRLRYYGVMLSAAEAGAFAWCNA